MVVDDSSPYYIYKDRREAGKLLAKRLRGYAKQGVVVLALPRGGVPVGREIAEALGAQLDLIIPGKIGAPGNPELAIGAVTEDGVPILNEELIRLLHVSPEYIEGQIREAVAEVERRMKYYRGTRSLQAIEGKTAIVVDDGIATGFTMLAALRAVRRGKPSRLILAVPVAPRDTLEKLKNEVDEAIVLQTPDPFYAVGQFYEDFSQIPDDEVRRLLHPIKGSQPVI